MAAFCANAGNRGTAPGWNVALRAGRAVTVAAMLALLGACGSGSPSGANLPDEAQALGDSGLWVSIPRARLMPAMSMGAVYFTVHNRSGRNDRLVAVSLVGATGEAMLHETLLEDGVSRMRHRMDGFVIGDGEDLVLEQGGAHVMLTGLSIPADAQSTSEGAPGLLLRFELGGAHQISLPAAAP